MKRKRHVIKKVVMDAKIKSWEGFPKEMEEGFRKELNGGTFWSMIKRIRGKSGKINRNIKHLA